MREKHREKGEEQQLDSSPERVHPQTHITTLGATFNSISVKGIYRHVKNTLCLLRSERRGCRGGQPPSLHHLNFGLTPRPQDPCLRSLPDHRDHGVDINYKAVETVFKKKKKRRGLNITSIIAKAKDFYFLRGFREPKSSHCVSLC